MAANKNKSNVVVENALDTNYYNEMQKQRQKHASQNVKQNMLGKFSTPVVSVIDEKEESCRTVKHQVLKEKMPNNNIIFHTDDRNWTSDDPEPIGDYVNVKEGIYDDDHYKYKDGIEVKSKRKNRTRSDSDKIDFYYSLPTSDHWLNNNNDSDDDFKYNPNSKEKKGKTASPSNKMKGGKKSPPSASRVLLYNNQSPRHFRISPSLVRSRETVAAVRKNPLMPKNLDAENNEVQVHHKNKKSIESHFKDDKIDSLSNDGDDDDDDDLDNVSNLGDSCDSISTSDSEDGYRNTVYKLAQSMDRMSKEESPFSSSQSSEENIQNPSSLLVPSLFPNVAPYLTFSAFNHKGPEVPADLFRILKWRISSVMPRVVRCVLTNSGMRLVKKTNDWIGVWGKHMKSPGFKTIRPYQKINHLPGSFRIGRKDACWRNLQKQMNKHGKKDFGFMPKTYIIPRDLNLLRKHWPKYAQRNVKWIIKPPASARGAGIRVVDRWAQIPKRKPLIVQKYIERPLLINGSKFDLRLYVLVTSINPLRVFMYHNGLARFASVKYSDKSDTLNDRCMHLTNYSINKFSSNYSKNEDVNACHGHKWTLKSLWSYLSNRGIRTDFLWEALRTLVLRTIMAGEQSINNMIKANVESKYSCFELFGFDVLLDADLIPWLLEVNISPSLHSELPLDAHVKAPLVRAVLNTALYQVPPRLSIERQRELCIEMSLPPGQICYDKRMYINYLSRAEKIKHNTYTRKTMEDRDEYINSILENLTPDDVRCLIVAEDELARCAPLERIFPTTQTYKYLKYTETPRYYNRLLDAWETRYAGNRAEGIELLREYCFDNYHLEIPPSPAKKQLKYRARTMMVTRPTGMALITSVRISSKRKSQRMLRKRETPKCKPHAFSKTGELSNSDGEVQ